MTEIKNAIRKIYSGENALQKHILLFVLAGVPAMLATPLNEMSKPANIANFNLWFILLALVISALISVYLGGYYYGVLHNSFDETKKELLPDFNKSWFNLFFKGFPIQVVWFVYLSFIFVVLALAFILIATMFNIAVPIGSAAIIGVPILVCLLFLVGLPFVYVEFAKNYERKGLYKFTLPIVYLKRTFKDVALLILKLIPLFVVVAIISFLGKGNDVIAYILTSLGAYLLTVLQYAASFSYVQIYKEKLNQ